MQTITLWPYNSVKLHTCHKAPILIQLKKQNIQTYQSNHYRVYSFDQNKYLVLNKNMQ